MFRRVLVSSAAAAAIVVGMIPGTAWAPRVTSLPDQTGTCWVTVDGATTQGTFLGGLSVTGFEAKGPDLVSHVVITGACNVGGTLYGMQDGVGTANTLVSNATCDSVDLIFAGQVTEKDTMVVDLSEMSVSLEPTQKTKGVLCGYAHGADRLDVAATARLFNRYLAL